LAEFLHFVNVDEAAAVAVGMWKAVFGTAFQARRAKDEDAVPSTATLPTERHFYSELSNFRHVLRFCSL
jgi:hypothetical protein